MRLKTICLVCALLFFGTAAPALSVLPLADPLTGTWSGDWGPSPTHRNQVTVELKWDGKVLTGSVNPGANAIALQKCTFDEKTGAVHLEADAKDRRGNDIHYVIEGKVENGTMTGSWDHGNRKGDFKITKK